MARILELSSAITRYLGLKETRLDFGISLGLDEAYVRVQERVDRMLEAVSEGDLRPSFSGGKYQFRIAKYQKLMRSVDELRDRIVGGRSLWVAPRKFVFESENVVLGQVEAQLKVIREYLSLR